MPKWTINPLMNSYVSPYEGKVIVFGDSEAGAAASNDALNMDSDQSRHFRGAQAARALEPSR